MLRHALKEWAVICKALAAGRQSVLLRKGGIAEAGDAFRVEQPQAWLFPTYLHQQQIGIVLEARPRLEEAERERPADGVLRLSHFLEVVAEYHVAEVERALRLADLHLWSEETVRSRFAYRRPGLHVLVVRVYRVPVAVETEGRPEYAGCRSWVDLGQAFPTAGATPVVPERDFRDLLAAVGRQLLPDAVA
jgi:hypothetical protein